MKKFARQHKRYRQSYFGLAQDFNKEPDILPDDAPLENKGQLQAFHESYDMFKTWAKENINSPSGDLNEVTCFSGTYKTNGIS